MLEPQIQRRRSPNAPHPVRKGEQVAAAARALFLEHGFMDTSMDAIARRAAVSKATLYAYFPTKEALFASLIKAECEAVDEGFVVPDLSMGLKEALRAFARRYCEIFRDGISAAFFRVIAAENGRFPDLCALFVESGPQKAIARCAGLLTNARDNGLLDISDPKLAATQFLSLVRGDLPLHAALGLREPFGDSVEAMIDAGIDVFLRAYGGGNQVIQIPAVLSSRES